MSSKNKNRKTLVDKWSDEVRPSKRKMEPEVVELELPPEAYAVQSRTEEELFLTTKPLSTAPRPLSRPINRKMTPYDFGKKNG